jgi:hypothetical protein
MHRSEDREFVACAVCATAVPPGVGYGVTEETVLCPDCAMERGGSFDAGTDRWVRAPRVDDLVEPER